MRIEYNSNNSGGTWWLEDKDWYALEKAGWKVEWAKDEAKDSKCPSLYKDGRWLGALARCASIEVEKPGDAMRSFEKATGQDVTDEGCNCCGSPHSFSWDDKYSSGEDCIEYLFGKPLKKLREFYEE